MNKNISFALAALAVSAGLVSCNESITSNNQYQAVYPAEVTNFSLTADSKVCPGLDSVFFSIDQLGLRIYNADSLPVGSRITALLPVITTRSASTVEFHISREGKADTIIPYTSEGSDSIDFSSGNVRLRVVSADGVGSVIYKVQVNVHKMIPDTLVWSRLEHSNLPTTFNGVSNQHTTMADSTIYCLTEYDSKFCIARAKDPAGSWEYATPEWNFTPNVSSFTGSDNALYILDNNGSLYSSTDGGVNWTSTGQKWKYIYGAYQAKLLGARQQGSSWIHTTWPVTVESTMPSSFPVSGTSQTLQRAFSMSENPQLMIIGGRLADGTVNSSVWGYDGNTWQCLKQNALPHQLENLSLVPYFSVKTNTNTWITTTGSVIMAWNGNYADGKLNDTVYVSGDFGMSWSIADSIMQPHTTMPSRTKAQAFTVPATLTVKSSVRALNGWRSGIKLDWQTVPGFTRNNDVPQISTCAVAPVTQWECPYIYMFGGENAGGQTMNTLYRGVITRFTFKPLQ